MLNNIFNAKRSLEPRENLKVIVGIDFKNDYFVQDILNLPGPSIDFLKEEYYNLDSQEIFDWNNIFDPNKVHPGTFYETEFFIRCEQNSYEDSNDMDCIATVVGVNQVIYNWVSKNWCYFGMDIGVEEHD